jgi:hypothetical protein
MKTEDVSANVVSIGGIAMTLAEFQTILTVAVLITGLVLNIVRIYIAAKNRNKKSEE